MSAASETPSRASLPLNAVPDTVSAWRADAFPWTGSAALQPVRSFIQSTVGLDRRALESRLTMTTPAVQINTIEIPVSNLKRAMDWYQSALRFNCEWSDEKHALLANEVKANSSQVRLLLVETLETVRLGFFGSSSGVHHGVIDFKAADLEALHAHISTLGTAIDEMRPPSLSWAPRGFGFLDSEGNRLAAFSYAVDR